MKKLLIATITMLSLATSTYATAEPTKHDKDKSSTSVKSVDYSPYAGRNFPTQVYFGDTHLHTAASGDAFGFGNKLTDDDVLQFASGAEITSSHGQQVKLSRPLDFLVVADHAEAYGAMIEVFAGNEGLMNDPKVKRWHNM